MPESCDRLSEPAALRVKLKSSLEHVQRLGSLAELRMHHAELEVDLRLGEPCRLLEIPKEHRAVDPAGLFPFLSNDRYAPERGQSRRVRGVYAIGLVIALDGGVPATELLADAAQLVENPGQLLAAPRATELDELTVLRFSLARLASGEQCVCALQKRWSIFRLDHDRK